MFPKTWISPDPGNTNVVFVGDDYATVAAASGGNVAPIYTYTVDEALADLAKNGAEVVDTRGDNDAH